MAAMRARSVFDADRCAARLTESPYEPTGCLTRRGHVAGQTASTALIAQA